MRCPSLFRPATAGLSTVFHLAIILQFSPTLGLSFTPVSQPDVDLSALGQVAFAGDFDAVSFYTYKEQSETAVNNGSQSILTPLPNGILTTLSTTDAHIRAMCPFTQKDGTNAGFFVGGNFTSLGGVEAHGAAMFDPDTKKVTALPGLDGSVSAVLCDKETNSVYVGGDFKYKNTSNAAAWVHGEGWKSLVFGGFNGPVVSIAKTGEGHIVFGGSFDGIGNSTSSKKNQQVINLQSATIASDAESSKSGYKDPKNIICQTSGEDGEGKTWLLADNSPGYWRADMGFGFNPTKIRLYNTHVDDRGTKSFLLRRLPDNGIMNLTYTDPDSGDAVFCDQDCALSNNKREKYREFSFVNSVGMKGFQIEVKSWYGSGAGLNGIQLLQDDIFAYAMNDFNEPTCADTKYGSEATRTGSWSVTPSGQSQSEYLMANITSSTASDTSVVFKPDVKQSGNYTILVYTPGCTQDGTCSSRGIVNVTATVKTDNKSSDLIQKTIHQTNLNDKYDTLYTGHVDASDSSFRPSVTLTPASGQQDVSIVASRVKFTLLHASNGLSGELNGLYDFDPTAKTTNSNFTESAVNRAGLQLDDNATVKSLVMHDGVMYASGNFSSSGIHHIMSLEGEGNATAMEQGGLNWEVTTMAILDDILYVGGNFTNTFDGSNGDLKRVAAYSVGSKKWSALGAGVNGRVQDVTTLSLNISSDLNETTIGVSGDFDELLAFGDNPAVKVHGFAVWVPSRKNWLRSMNVSQMAFTGQLTASASVGNTSVLAGSLTSGGIAAAGAVGLLHDEGLNIQPLLPTANFTGGAYTGIYDTRSNRNLTILGGRFTTTGSDTSPVKNLAIIDGSDSTIKGLDTGVDSNSTFLALAVSQDKLYAGGNVTGSIGDSKLNGLVVYDLENGTYAQKQPPRFTGGDATVRSIAVRPDSDEVYFGGHFENAGALLCPGVCYYDGSEHQWNRPGATLTGSVLALKWMSNKKLLAVGNLTVEGNSSVIATYIHKKQSWQSLQSASEISGTVTAFTPASKDVSTFWIAGVSTNGSSFLANYDGSRFQFAGDIFGDGTTINHLEMLPLSKDHSDVNLLHDDQIVLVAGQLVVPDFGNASAALFNGTHLTPFMLTSSSNGQPGSLSKVFYSKDNPYSSEGKHRSNGIVILISFCCALGCVFLIVIAGVIFNKIQRRRQGYMPGPQAYGTDRPSSMRRLPPEYLFSSLKTKNPGTPAI
ncbi:cortical protein marker for cell polarity-domain-containing protein [Aspergillus avenaceus]|uniref:Cortical protein marker for cell polarity-domain-containing protein n=1 Tax=Aspergillus avenaceus TaxID=36643 RepID=A0A5N6TN02_ASPAV|nr:cortical protein marker for cell polarity-domain-containing protein [Aspergillus avenaceus]